MGILADNSFPSDGFCHYSVYRKPLHSSPNDRPPLDPPPPFTSRFHHVFLAEWNGRWRGCDASWGGHSTVISEPGSKPYMDRCVAHYGAGSYNGTWVFPSDAFWCLGVYRKPLRRA
ncbi:hypothetical protein CALCODRAFT_495033 [Calocera cornea HHB12733]|uniref:Uncharacterized protein n=1 Tax=Calocera cornea HHB12733 TaxID=1353952 RepID=A0A165GPI9_9BASI|nr:hypothetical protein CALCODRAFT_495033 [Calocera cornea HHB12733]